MSAVEPDDQSLPPLSKDRAFLGMTATQLLGAFNDNVYQYLLVLFYMASAEHDPALANRYQSAAAMIFAVPFVLFSGVAGWWSDRVVKRNVVIGSKLAEIVVMGLGLFAFLSGYFYAPFVVLFLMAMQSTFFGPSKYGILPEMLRERDLPAANGYVQMTTFLAIIFGTVVAGAGAQLVGNDRIWLVSLFCIGVAFVGTTTSLLLRPTPIAHPNLKFTTDVVFLSRETLAGLRRDSRLRNALVVVSVFWFVAGVVRLTSTQYTLLQLGVDKFWTSVVQGVIAIGIAVGCVVCGQMSRQRVRPEFVQRGAIGLALTLFAVAVVGLLQSRGADSDVAYVASATLLFGLGISTGFFVVPLQVVLQTRSPRELKGRVIAAQNLFNFVGLFLAGAVYGGLGQMLEAVELPVSMIFGAMGLLMVAIAAGYRPSMDHPADELLGDEMSSDGVEPTAANEPTYVA